MIKELRIRLKRELYSIPILLMICFLPLQAGKKPPPIPLKVLTDPNSPSYVPHPYPKTDFEIIEDFKYAVKEFYSPKEVKRVSMLPGIPDFSKIILPLLGDNPSLEVEEIIKVNDLVETSPSRYLFLLKVVNQKGEVVVVGLIRDCGLLGAIQFFTREAKFRSFKKEPQVKELLQKALGYSIPIDKMERIAIHSTICTSPYAPLWKIETPIGVFFVDHFDDLYYVEAEVPWSRELGHPNPHHKKITVLDSLNDKVFFLKKIRGK